MVKRITSAKDLRRGARLYYVTLFRPAGEIELPVRRLTVGERERLDADIPEPFPPRIVKPDGAPALDSTDKDYLVALGECHRKRREARVVTALGPEFFEGQIDRAEQIRVLREELEISPEDIMSLDAQIRNPQEVTALDVEAAAEKLAPFAETPPTV